MRVEDWMTPDPLTAGADVKLQEALAQMVRHRVRHLPVLDGGDFFGLLSGPSLLQKLLVNREIPLEEAADMPLRNFVEIVGYLSPGDEMEAALARLDGQNCLPVLREQRLEGLFTHQNVLGYLQRQMLPGRVRRGGSTPTTHRLDSLLSLIRSVSTATGLHEIMQMTAHFLRNLMPLSQAFLLVRHQQEGRVASRASGEFPAIDGKEFKVAASYYARPSLSKEKIDTLPLQDTLSGYVYTHRRSLRIDDLRDEKRFPRSASLWSAENENQTLGDDVELRSVISTPLMDQHRSFGVLHVWADRPYAYVDSDLELLELVSGYLSFLILRSWQLQKEQNLVQELQQANRIKDEFLAVVTHDLRNSIQGILALAQLLQRRVEEPSLKELTRAIQDSVTHMSSLTRDLHDLAKLGMQAIRLNLSRCLVAATVQLVTQEFSEYARQSEVTLAPIELGAGLEILADPVRIRQIIANLVSNAIKYNRPGGWVRIRGRGLGSGEMLLEVQDNGIGIAPDEQAAVFQLFQQATNNRRLDGSGLGLAISQQLAELHGGRLEVESELGKGSTFRLVLPLSTPLSPLSSFSGEPESAAGGHGGRR